MVDETPKIGPSPAEPGWVLLAIVCATLLYWWDKAAWPISLAIALVAGFGWLRYLKAKASWQRKFLDWQIENAEGWIAYFKAQLAEGPPWFDGIDGSDTQTFGVSGCRRCVRRGANARKFQDYSGERGNYKYAAI